MSYVAPALKAVGSFHELTLSDITKTSGSGDVIHIGTTTISVPGSGVITVS